MGLRRSKRSETGSGWDWSDHPGGVGRYVACHFPLMQGFLHLRLT